MRAPLAPWWQYATLNGTRAVSQARGRRHRAGTTAPAPSANQCDDDTPLQSALANVVRATPALLVVALAILFAAAVISSGVGWVMMLIALSLRNTVAPSNIAPGTWPKIAAGSALIAAGAVAMLVLRLAAVLALGPNSSAAYYGHPLLVYLQVVVFWLGVAAEMTKNFDNTVATVSFISIAVVALCVLAWEGATAYQVCLVLSASVT